jgi:hypothetical protein
VHFLEHYSDDFLCRIARNLREVDRSQHSFAPRMLVVAALRALRVRTVQAAQLVQAAET